MIRHYDNHSLRLHNSFGVEARASKFIEFGGAAELAEFLAGNPGIVSGQWAVLGGGNNILFTRDYEGTLLRPTATDITVTGEDHNHVYLNVSAGHDWDGFVAWCVERGLWGAENLSWIPGLAGAAPVQNIGAYGAEVKDMVVSVEMLHTDTMKINTLAAGHCCFGYRDSVFKNALKGRVVITSVNLRLGKQPAPNTSYGALREEVERLGGPTLENIRRGVINIRRSKLPDPAETGNAGSFFKNPVVPAAKAAELEKQYPGMPQYPGGPAGTVKLAAGWLIEKAGWKGRRRGNAGVYEKQALIIVNHGGATGSEIAGLAAEIQMSVKEMFGVDIDTEVNIW